jgi:transposase-like protein
VGQARKKYTREYKDEAVELVISSGRPIAEIARNLGINEGTLANWVNTAGVLCMEEAHAVGAAERRRDIDHAYRGDS